MPYPTFVGYTKNEIEDMRLVVEEHGDVDYSGEIIFLQFLNIDFNLDHMTVLDEEILRKNKYFDQLENIVVTRPIEMEKAPYAEITVKLGKSTIPEILEDICDCLFIPFKISVDFFAAASSPNRPLEIIHPSIGTCCNENRLMRGENDFENLYNEFEAGVPFEKMLRAHSASRKIIVDSGLRITDILAMRVFISRLLYQLRFQ